MLLNGDGEIGNGGAVAVNMLSMRLNALAGLFIPHTPFKISIKSWKHTFQRGGLEDRITENENNFCCNENYRLGPEFIERFIIC